MARILDRLQEANAPGLPRGLYTWAQRVCEQIEAALDAQALALADIEALQLAQTDLIADLTAAVADITAAQADADAAIADAAAAAADAAVVSRDSAIASSYPIPGEVLTAADAGASTTVTIAAHTRRYGDLTEVSVSGGSVGAISYSQRAYIYYDDPTRAGGSVSYQATLNANVALPQKATGRHYVGSIITPAAAAPPTTGGSSAPSGGGAVNRDELNIYG